MTDWIVLQGDRALLQKLERLGRRDLLNAVLTAGGLYLRRRFATYPPKRRPTRASVYGRAFQSDRQRKYFFAALRDGRLEVPYRRGMSPGSETLGKRWAVYSKSMEVVAVGNNASYARRVQSLQDQSLYMRAVGWVPVETTLVREQANVTRSMEIELKREIARLEGK